MATQSDLYSSVTAFVLTGASLADKAAREGTLVANSTNLYIDMLLSGKITTGAAISAGNCYILLSSSDATNISYPATGADAGITPGSLALASLELLASPYVPPFQKVPGTELVFFTKLSTAGTAAGAAFTFQNLSVAAAFNGQIPIGGWAPVLVNMSGQALSATATVFNWTGVKYTIA